MEMFNVIRHLFKNQNREEVVEIVGSVEPFMLNRWLSFNMVTLWNISRRMNKYIFRVPKPLLHGLFTYLSKPQRMSPDIRYIPKRKNNTEIPEEFINIKKYYNWSQREFEENLPLLQEVGI